MNWKRAKAIGKLLLLFGTPLLVVLGLFGSGVYVGNLYRHGITSFEKEWLGLDVEVAPPHDAETSETTASSKDESDKGDKSDKGDESDSDETPKPESSDAKPAAETPAKPAAETPAKPDVDAAAPTTPTPEPPAKPAAVPSEPVVTPPPAPEPELQAKVDPLDGALDSRLGVPVRVGVKVFVDELLVEQHPDWIDYVQRTVSQASAVYTKQFGVSLELVSVGRWGVPTAGMSSAELLADVESRPREAAQLVVGLTGRPLDDRTSGKAYTPDEDSPFNGSAAVVYAHAQQGRRNPHVRGLLHEVGHLFGARDITDPSAPGYRSGSWMSYAPVRPDQAAWIDPANRARILERKDKPFAAQGAMTVAPEPASQPASEDNADE